MINQPELMIIDLTEQSKAVYGFLYSLFSIPETIPIGYDTRITYYHKAIIEDLIMGMTDKETLILELNQLRFLNIVSPEHVELFRANHSQLIHLQLYLIAYLNNYLGNIRDSAFTVKQITSSYVVISVHRLNREADDLVFRN